MALRPAEGRAETDKETAAAAPETWRDCMRAGMELARTGELHLAVSCFDAARQTRSDHPQTLHTCASTLLRAGKTDAACRGFSQLIQLVPELPSAWHGLGLARHGRGEIDEALGAFRQAARLDPKAWRSWQSIADITPDEDERILAIGHAADSLEARAGDPRTKPDIILRVCNALADAHRFEDAVIFARNNLSRFPDQAFAHERIGHCLYAAGAFQPAFEQLKRALACTACPTAAPSTHNHGFDPGKATEALNEVCTILSAAGLVPFLAAGTLLGFIRNGQPLTHDRDIDIGVFADEAAPGIAAIVRQHPALMLERRARPGERYFALTHKGIGVDIFLYEKTARHALCGFSHHPGDIQWRFTDFRPIKSRFQGLTCHIPESPERYLTETYGPDWQIPDHGFASAISSPALYKTDAFARACYSAARARRALKAGDRGKARALINQSPIPVPLQPDMQDASTDEMNRQSRR
ncbi:tetratricopeptide repeat protein [Henriciella sp.]|uniref:tetratricopeptide repeat protein n=1 Tax=Henriciella sp. TaxID=1968823 RepID=UPI00261122FB|nr:tetratricopeptide repeat protein [Henriciella sp.]